MTAALVALHTLALGGEAALRYAELLTAAVRAGRPGAAFAPRRALDQTLRALALGVEAGLYEQVYVDARSGLPNLASVTRVVTDAELLGTRDASGEARARYEALLRRADPLPVDTSRVVLRRVDAATGQVELRFELIKIDGAGHLTKVAVEMTQRDRALARELVDVEPENASARAGDLLRTTVYRYASQEAEVLLGRLHELGDVRVRRVERGVLGPFLFGWREGEARVCPQEAEPSPASALWLDALGRAEGDAPVVLLQLATDRAGTDVKREGSDDPLAPLLAATLPAEEQARYRKLRARHPYRVRKERKFVASRGLVPAIRAWLEQEGARAIVYPLPRR